MRPLTSRAACAGAPAWTRGDDIVLAARSSSRWRRGFGSTGADPLGLGGAAALSALDGTARRFPIACLSSASPVLVMVRCAIVDLPAWTAAVPAAHLDRGSGRLNGGR